MCCAGILLCTTPNGVGGACTVGLMSLGDSWRKTRLLRRLDLVLAVVPGFTSACGLTSCAVVVPDTLLVACLPLSIAVAKEGCQVQDHQAVVGEVNRSCLSSGLQQCRIVWGSWCTAMLAQ